MAHLVESMAYKNDTPWHGLGNRISTKQPIEVWQKEAGMNWTIEEAAVRFVASATDSLGTIHSYPEQKVLYRSDTKAPLSVVSQRYQVVQPREVLEFYRDLTESSGFELETAGVLKGGKKVWALARTNQSATFKGNDVVNGYLLLATAHDGTLCTTAQFTSVRVVCNNTLAISLANGTGAIKVPHSTSFDAQAVKRQLGISVGSWDTFMFQMKALSERKVKSNEVEQFFMRVFSDPRSTAVGANDRAMKKALAMFNGQGRGAELTSAKGTAFGLLSAVTEFVDHERRARSTENRLESAWFGAGAGLKQKATDQALLMVA